MIDALLEALALKAVPRTGWVRRGLTDVESVAAHSWAMSLLVLVLAPPELDLARALSYAILHDLGEAWVGDIPPQDGIEDKATRESAAMAAWARRLDRPALFAAWTAYEQQADAEARFVRQLDGLDMAMQARRYAVRGLDPSEFLGSARRKLVDPDLLALLDDLASLAPVRTVRFVGRAAHVHLALALGRARFADQIQFGSTPLPLPTAPVRDVLAEAGLLPVTTANDLVRADVVIQLGTDTGTAICWAIDGPTDDLTALRSARDAIRQRLDLLVPG